MMSALDNDQRSGRPRAAAALALLFLAACGGGDSLTRDEYLERVQEICGSAVAEERSLDQPTFLAEGFGDYLQKIARIRERMVSDIRELDAPTTIEADVDRWLALLDRLLARQRKYADLVQAGDVESATSFLEETDPPDGGGALASKLGIRCGEADPG